MPPEINMKGKSFNYLKVIERARNTKSGEAAWVRECKCGTRKIIAGSKLRNGETKSCGCMKKELAGTKKHNTWNERHKAVQHMANNNSTNHQRK